MKKFVLSVIALCVSLSLSSCVTTGGGKSDANVKPYPLKTCMVIDRPFNKRGPKYTRVRDGQEYGFCCSGCVKVFEASPDFYVDKLAKKVAAMKAGAGPDDPAKPVVLEAPTIQ